MLASQKIEKAFLAIVEEAEQARSLGVSDEVAEKLKKIISIAKHQNDIRNAAEGSCKSGTH